MLWLSVCLSTVVHPRNKAENVGHISTRPAPRLAGPGLGLGLAAAGWLVWSGLAGSVGGRGNGRLGGCLFKTRRLCALGLYPRGEPDDEDASVQTSKGGRQRRRGRRRTREQEGGARSVALSGQEEEESDDKTGGRTAGRDCLIGRRGWGGAGGRAAGGGRRRRRRDGPRMPRMKGLGEG
ncbi:hypothetical protein Mp_3g06030 [Marchantia polymorpha subsp. ruderalis]|uniref:Uncharacterized protein n=2 Tax=Marchantia polymorpha TaxID=3197 RepID=A0AAF6AXW4_MARPO|nr:hypothetical protein MARPO_0006s0073 [Marchantia polymorpha]BBN04598.1 hypothetical protein Mp_3g06030 [Marchantia polymorpha subsp. ruderalis]|eukprot:PTQ48034.1 hypothetical protein MARPO_0006s0073 [Marchantia polymorpha]